MKLIYCVLIMLCPFVSKGQEAESTRALRIGEGVPDVKLKDILNATYTKSSLASYKEELVLLDFWATWCSSCIKTFPKTDALQKDFENKLRVLLINNDGGNNNYEKVKTFLAKQKRNGYAMALPVIVNDKELIRLFPHRSLPHIVWIYKGKFIALTGAEEVNSKNINAVLNGEPVGFDMKLEQMDFDVHGPLIENKNGGEETAIISRSLFTKYLEGAGGAIGNERIAGTSLIRRFYINKSILKLYSYVYPGLPGNRIVLEVKDSTRLISPNHDARWRRQHCYCYEFILPLSMGRERSFAFMQADLDRTFGLKSSVESRTVECYAVVQIPSENSGKKPMAKYKEIFESCEAADSDKKSLTEWVDDWNRQVAGKPIRPIILDETGSGGLMLTLKKTGPENVAYIKAALMANDLDLLQVRRTIDVLIISEQNLLPINSFK